MGWFRRVFIVLATSAVASGCLVLEDVQFEVTEGVFVQGSCMCATCWNRPFCLNRDTGESVPLAPNDDCPAGFEESAEATRILATSDRLADERSAVFHCVPDFDEARLAPIEDTCPSREDEAADRALVENVHPCVDVPLCRRTGAAFAECSELPGPEDPLCPDLEPGAGRSACGRTDGNARLGSARGQGKLVESCALYGQDIPDGDAPERYCYLNCIDEQFFCLGRDGDIPADCDFGCDPDLFDPPSVRNQNLLVRVGPPSLARLTVRINRRIRRDIVRTDEAPVEGLVALEAPGCGPGQSCRATLTLFDVRATEPFEIGDRRIERAWVLNTDPIPDDITAMSTGESMLTIPAGGTLFASATITGQPARSGAAFTPTEPITGTIEWSNRTVRITTVLGDPDPDETSLELVLVGSLDNLLPLADAGPDQLVECTAPVGTPVQLSAAASRDPDGVEDLARFTWTGDLGEGTRQIASGVEPTVNLPPGRFPLTVQVTDRAGASDLDGTRVEVVDSTGPRFEAVDVVTDCLWDPDHRMQLLRLGTEIQPRVVDACEGSVTAVRIVDVHSNQPADARGDGATTPDVRFGSGATCLRAERQGGALAGRGYTVVLEAVDSRGNATREEVVIRVPHDQRPQTRCTTGDLAPVVPDDDPRCEMDAPAPTATELTAPVAGLASARSGGCAVSHARGARPEGLLGLLLAVGWLFERRRRTK